MAIKIYKEKMKYLDKLLVELPQKVDPKDCLLYTSPSPRDS